MHWIASTILAITALAGVTAQAMTGNWLQVLIITLIH